LRELFRNVLFLVRMAQCLQGSGRRDSFHPRDADLVPHADVVYEDRNGKFLGKRHVTEKPEDQAKVWYNVTLNDYFGLWLTRSLEW